MDAQPPMPPTAKTAITAIDRRNVGRRLGLSAGFAKRLIEQSLQLIFIFTRFLA